MIVSALTPIRRRAAVLLAAVAVLLGFAASARPAHALEVAVNDDAVLLSGRYYSRNLLLQQARAMGASWVRVNFTYADYARAKYQFLDGLVNAARANRMNVHITLTGTSQQDGRGNKRISYNRPSAKKFASWVKTIAKHYKGRVRRYSLWNEPQFPYFLAPTRNGPAMYCALYKAGYRAIKSVDRRSKVLWGELAPLRDPLGFMRKAACRGTRTDGLAFHPYALKKGALGLGSTPAIKRAAKKYLHTKSIYYTEFGYIRAGLPFGMSDSKRAQLTVAGFKYARRQGVRNLTYYILIHPPWAFRIPFDSGIINANGSPTPVYTALKRYLTGR
jgi:hypothetical protein